MERTYEIPESRIPGLQYRVNKVVARAKKHGLFQPSFKVVGTIAKTIEVRDPLAMVRGHDSDTKNVGIIISQVTTSGFDPQLGEWNIVGFRHGHSVNGGATVVNDTGVVPPEKHGSPLCCDHCGYNRRRKETLIVCRESDGQVAEVGTSCLSAFMGVEYSDSFLKTLSDAGRMLAEIEAASNWSFNDPELSLQDEILNVLAVAVSIIREDGFVNSREAGAKGVPPTSFQVATELSRLNNANTDKSTVMVIKTDFDIAEKVLDHIKLMPGSDDFTQKLKACVERGLAHPRDIGLLAAAVGGYNKDMERKKQADGYGDIVEKSTGQGEAGVRHSTVVTVAQIKNIDTDYGSFCVVSFVDERSNLLVWKTSSSHDFVEGHRYEIAGRVKDHSVARYHPFKGAAETILTNVKAKDHFGPATPVDDAPSADTFDDELYEVLGI